MANMIEVTIQLTPEQVEQVEKFRADVIRANSVHGTRDTTEWFKQMGFDELVQKYFDTLVAKEGKGFRSSIFRN